MLNTLRFFSSLRLDLNLFQQNLFTDRQKVDSMDFRILALISALAFGTFLSCATIDQKHLDAWRQVPVAMLETHPLWGVPDQKIELSTGEIAYVYYASEAAITHAITDDMAVIRNPVCKYVFIISKNVVQSMTAKGQCYTSDEQMPPAKSP
jgi:hypothetical protein